MQHLSLVNIYIANKNLELKPYKQKQVLKVSQVGKPFPYVCKIESYDCMIKYAWRAFRGSIIITRLQSINCFKL